MDKTCHKNLEKSKYIDLIMAMGKSFQNSLAVPVTSRAGKAGK